MESPGMRGSTTRCVTFPTTASVSHEESTETSRLVGISLERGCYSGGGAGI